MYHKSKVIAGAARYINTDILSKLKGGIWYWIIGAAADMALSDAERTITALMDHPIAKFYNVCDGEMIDVDAIYARIHARAEQSTATVNLKALGPVTLSAKDVDTIYQYIREA